MKIFWSWQSDKAQRVCRHFVKEALEAAAHHVTKDLELDESERPEVDHDTLGEPGLVDIVATIFGKIDKTSVFVADMTPIAKTDQGKLLANPNVLIELGYAMRAIGPEHIILVANTAWGGTPEDLPFDLRHRRGPLTYRLHREATDAEVISAKRVFAEQLASALSTSMRSFIRNRDATVNLSGHAARPNDPSVWFAIGERLKHRDSLGGMRMEEVEVYEGPRAYMRIIPAGWLGKTPNKAMVSQVPSELRVRPLGDWRSSDDGVNDLGFLATEIRGGQREGDTRRTRTATQLFLPTGEIWGFDQKVVEMHKGKQLLADIYLIQKWSDFLRCGIALLRHLGAAPPFRVEAGVTGLASVHWPGRLSLEQIVSVADIAKQQRQSREWNDAEQRDFVTHAYNAVRDAFGLPNVTTSDVFARISRGDDQTE